MKTTKTPVKKFKRECGVNQSLYQEYKFEDHVWFQNQPNYDDYLYLAQRCVKIGTSYLMKKAGNDHWICMSNQTDAEREAVNTWLGATLPSGTVVDQDMIATFFTGVQWQQGASVKMKPVAMKVGSCPNIYQKMSMPLGPRFLTYKNQQYLNTWFDDQIEGDLSYVHLGKSVLLLCYASLCNGNVDKNNLGGEAERIYKMVIEDNYDNLDFRFLMYWLAAIVQRPGINLQTNIWLMGELQGLGKGTIVTLMGYILGLGCVGELNQIEIEAGWSDHLVGLQLVEINEFDTTGKMSGRAWNKWIKGHTVEPTLKIRERGKTSYNVLHVGNFIGVSNLTDQNFIDKNDRRNQFIQTSSDPFWVQFATSIQLKYVQPSPKEVAAGFASILEQVRVDYDFIAKSHHNQLRANIAANNQNIVEEWAENDPTITRNKWIMAREMYAEFKSWFHQSHPSDPIPSETAWGRVMVACGRLGVAKRTVASGNQYNFGTPEVVVKVDLSEAVAALNSITGDSGEIEVFDVEVVNGMIDPTAMTPIQKLRAALAKQDDRFGDFE